ncbi:MAG: DUF560 domain-containing protein [Alphaproteobacteria bacterium]|nr:MAG: DUF560 domain-containing protein [Alphaproteobacteria bacterium]
MKYIEIKSTVIFAIACSIALALASTGPAAAEGSEFSVDGYVGLEHEDNITVTEIDAETNEGDWAAILELGAEYEVEIGEKNTLSFGYDFNMSEQFDLSDFDQQIHGANATFERDIGGINAGLTYQFFYARLGGEGLLDMHRVSPFITVFPTKKLFIRAAYTYKDKDLKNRTARDAETHMGEISGFYFIDGTDTFASLGYRYEDEDAFADEFDFEAHVFKAGIDTRLPFGGEKNRFEIDVTYEIRDYSAVTPSIGEVRDDDRLTVDVSWEVPFNELLFGRVGYRYRDFSSNLPSADFSENLVSFGIGFEY